MKKIGRFLCPLLLFGIILAIITGESRSCAAALSRPRPYPVTLVIDAGHGGMDGGAAAADGTGESGINLAVAQRVECIARLFGLHTVMTRREEEIDYPADCATIREKKRWDLARRVELTAQTEAPMLLSIHQNKYPDARPSGCQVLYAASAASEQWGKLTHDTLTAYLCPASRRVAAPASDSIYLLRHVQCPAILAECGFLSNPDDAEKLASSAYQCRLSALLTGSLLIFLQNDRGI